MIFNFACCGSLKPIGGKTEIKILSDTCVYSNDDHVAFTSLEEWRGNMYVAFREGKSHNSTSEDKGKICVLKKKHVWELHNVFSLDNIDLRDPFLLKWKNRLFLYTVGYYSELTDSGWTRLTKIHHNASHPLNIWKIREYKSSLYGVGNAGGKWPLMLKSEDGKNWEVIDEYMLGGDASEADMVFVKDSLYVCIRIDKPTGSKSMWGKSFYPFTDMKWNLMDFSVASPDMMKCSEKTFLLAGREYIYDKEKATIDRFVTLWLVDGNGKVITRHSVNLVANGDKGYPSFCHYDGKCYMSYYDGQLKTQIRLLILEVAVEK